MFDLGGASMKSNQMKFVRQNGEMKYLDVKLIDLNDLVPMGFGYGHNEIDFKNYLDSSNKEVACAIESPKVNIQNCQIIDVGELKRHFIKVWKQWFPFGERNTTMAVGVFWTAFMTYIFPWLLDIAKVYCAWRVVQGFYQEGKGLGGREGGGGGRGGFGSLVYYGKWYLAFWLIPWGVQLIDEIGQQMHSELLKHGLDGLKAPQ